MTRNENEEEIEMTAGESGLFMHKRRPEWGVALLTWEGNDRRRYQFQDGTLRTFKDGFYHLFEPLDASAAVETTLLEDLERKHGMALADRKAREAHTPKAPVMKFEEQVEVFDELYPGGFQNQEYVETFRNRENGRRLKRLVDPAIAEAQQRLSQDALRGMLEREDWAGVHAAMLQVMKRTGLASPSKVVAPLQALDPQHFPRLSYALYDLLYGDGKVGPRFREWVMALDAEGSVQVDWPMATVLPALVHPDEHVCVRRKAFRLQARSIDPDALVRKHPSPKGYRRARRIARKVHERLVEAGMEPRDLFDVRQFVWQTLRPKGQGVLDELKARRFAA